jgi:hypothetical protein
MRFMKVFDGAEKEDFIVGRTMLSILPMIPSRPPRAFLAELLKEKDIRFYGA